MTDARKPRTDRELLLDVVGRLDNVSESMGRIADTLEKLENNKIASHDVRITKLEKWMNEWGGALKVIVILLLVVQIITYVSKWI